ncbi:MAG: DUF4199 domain-containing protein [Ignavibacteria bacterium]|nr:DUF4199 domain-containing protein [Ignavibacteria bacterium]
MKTNRNRLLPIIYGSLVMTFLYLTPILNFVNLLCCAGVILGAAVGVITYIKQIKNTDMELSVKDGGIIGFLCGLLSGILTTVIYLTLIMFSNINPISEALPLLEKLNLNFNQNEMSVVNKISEEISRSGFSLTFSVYMFVYHLIGFTIFGFLGGLLTSTLIRKSNLKKIKTL